MLRHLLFLLEGTGEQIREFYKDIPEDIYYDILKVDPSGIIRNGKVDKVGKYSKHLLEIYKKTKFNKKDLEGLEEILKTYDKVQREIGKPFNQIKTINEIKELVNNVSEKAKADKESKIIMKDSGYIVRQILGKSAAVYYGNYCGHGKTPKENQSSWCTAYKDGSFYNNYKAGKLYIVSKDEELIAQLYFGDYKNEIQDRFNKSFNIESIKSDKIREFFKELSNTDQAYTFAGRKFKYKLINDIIVFGNLDISHRNFKNTLSEMSFLDKKWKSDKFEMIRTDCEEIPENLFKNCINVKDIILTDNKIQILENLPKCESIFAAMNKIKSVNLKNDCDMLILNDNLIDNLSNIKLKDYNTQIYIENNKIETITVTDKNVFKNTNFIHSNLYGQIQNKFSKLTSIKDFDLMLFNNPISKLKSIVVLKDDGESNKLLYASNKLVLTIDSEVREAFLVSENIIQKLKKIDHELNYKNQAILEIVDTIIKDNIQLEYHYGIEAIEEDKKGKEIKGEYVQTVIFVDISNKYIEISNEHMNLLKINIDDNTDISIKIEKWVKQLMIIMTSLSLEEGGHYGY